MDKLILYYVKNFVDTWFTLVTRKSPRLNLTMSELDLSFGVVKIFIFLRKKNALVSIRI